MSKGTITIEKNDDKDHDDEMELKKATQYRKRMGNIMNKIKTTMKMRRKRWELRKVNRKSVKFYLITMKRYFFFGFGLYFRTKLY